MKNLMLSFVFVFYLIYSNTVLSQFSNPQPVNVCTAVKIDTIDFDLDGDYDAISLNGGRGVIIFENSGNDSFNQQHELIYNYHFDLVDYEVSDIDGDFDHDIVIVGDSAKLIILENIGSNEFIEREFITVAYNYENIEIGDLTMDGFPDIIAYSDVNQEIVFFENDGQGNFINEQVLASNIYGVNGLSTINLVDLDLDNDLDIFYPEDSVRYILNNGGGNFDIIQTINSSNLLNNTTYADPKDIDGDNDIDIIGVNILNSGLLILLENNGSGYNAPIILDSLGLNVTGMKVVDFDQDSDLDVLVSYSDSNGITLSENFGSLVFEKRVLNSNMSSVYDFEIVDYNGDSFKDVIYNSLNSNFIAINNNGIDLGDSIVIGRRYSQYESMLAQDIDGDNLKDLIFSFSSGSQYYNIIVWQKNLGGGSFGVPQIVEDNLNDVREIDVEDIDQDGYRDIVYSIEGSNEIGWYKNNNGIFNLPRTIIDNNVLGAFSVRIADIDNDGDNDLVSASRGDSIIAWYSNDGTGNFGPKQIIPILPSLVPDFIHVSDFDNDGDSDIAYAHNSGTNIYLIQNLGGGSFDASLTVTMFLFSNGIEKITSADYDDDGDEDLLVASSFYGSFTRIVNDGGFTFTSQPSQGGINQCFDAIYTDISGDRKDDILVIGGNSSSSSLAWYKQDEFGDFVFENYLPSRTNDENYGRGILTLDYDFDGDEDVFFTRFTKTFRIENFHRSKFTASGSIFYDINQNGVRDSLEIGLNNISTFIQPNALFGQSYTGGGYSYSLDTGQYTVSVQNPITNWLLSTPSNYTFDLSDSISIVDTLDFGFYPTLTNTIIRSEITGGFPRCDAVVNYDIAVFNEGTTNPNVRFNLSLDPNLSYVSSNISPDSIVGNDLYWSVDSLSFFSSDHIELEIQFPGVSSMGDTVLSILKCDELDQSFNVLYSSIDSLRQRIQCSYDPNDKSVHPEGEGIEGIIDNNQYLEYLIRFQNTGTDTAINILVKDELSDKFDWSSIEILNYSDPVQMQVDSAGIVSFIFDSIMLPDSGANYLGSQGFVKYQINMLPNLPSNTVINNTAEIYFDNNPAIITNTTLNTIRCYDYMNLSIIEVNDSLLNLLSTYSFSNIDWYRNDTLLIGENSEILEFSNDGIYRAEVVDSNQCIYDVSILIGDLFNNNLFFNYSATFSPNPFSNYTVLNSDVPFNGDQDLIIYDIMGREVYKRRSLSGNQIVLNKNSLRTGVFIPVIQNRKSGERTELEKLICK